MTHDHPERRLAAILAADVVGFSRLIGVDEVATLDRLKRHRSEVVETEIARHRGRIVKLTGDGLLAEFPSVVNAVCCAVEIQQAMAARNTGVSADQRIEFRIGVNLGDVVVEEDDIFGDGVNIAARLESIAEPGGVSVSGSVREHIGNRLDLIFEDTGPQSLKNINQPVRVFRIVAQAAAAKGDARTSDRPRGEKPSIAVLPFTNMSGDPEQEYFADGITEDLITDLSKVSGLSVIARNSVFAYKGRPADVQEICRRFNVATALEGSVRKAGQRVRITAQLIGGRDGTHLWADRYDRDLTDIFALQDEITRTIVDQLKVRLLPAEKHAIEAEPTSSVDAYNYYLQGRHLYHLHSTQHALMAQRLFRKAVELDPGYARAYSGLADCGWLLIANHHEGAGADEIMEASTRALALDPHLAEAHASHGIALYLSGRKPEAFAKFEAAIALDPDLYEAHYLYAYACRDSNDRARSAMHYQRAAELAPDDYRSMILYSIMLRDLGRTDEYRAAGYAGIERAERALKLHPEIPLPAALGSAILAALGERTRSLEWAERAMTIAPDDSHTLYNVACTLTLLGERERAIDLLEKWVLSANKATLGWLRNDSDFDSLRDHPRFKALVEAAG